MDEPRIDGSPPALVPPPGPGTTATGAKLTRREREVLRLLALGRSDREIAAALAIRTRTAEWHVANLRRKLGVASRTAAATHAFRHGLA